MEIGAGAGGDCREIQEGLIGLPPNQPKVGLD
jgi:hypothetical protein